MTPEERQRQIREVADWLAERLGEHWPADGTDVVDLEDFAERFGRDLQAELGKRTLEREAARKEDNQSTCPECGGRAFFQRFHGLTLVTAAGRLRVRRAIRTPGSVRKRWRPADTHSMWLSTDTNHTPNPIAARPRIANNVRPASISSASTQTRSSSATRDRS